MFKKHKCNCDTCALFKFIWNRKNIYFRCNGDKMPYASDFPIMSWLMTHGCLSWVEKENLWYLKEGVKMEKQDTEHKCSCNYCGKFGSRICEYSDAFILTCDGEDMPYKDDLPIIDWIGKKGCCSWVKK